MKYLDTYKTPRTLKYRPDYPHFTNDSTDPNWLCNLNLLAKGNYSNHGRVGIEAQVIRLKNPFYFCFTALPTILVN